MLTKSIVEDLIVGCDLPISIVENDHFRCFMATVDPQYGVPCRRTVVNYHLPALLQAKKEAMMKLLSFATDVALTVDIWSDRRQHSFLGVTGHFVQNGALKTQLIHFKSFRGSHTGVRIAEALEDILFDQNYGLRTKVHYIVTDNASNMKKAATFLFQCREADNINKEENETETGTEGSQAVAVIDDDDALDDPTLYEDITLDDLTLRDDALSGERLPCFAHSLQLTVRDGLKKNIVSRTAVAKCTKLANLAHQSTTFKSTFEDSFGKNRSIPAANDTRWNSFYYQMNAIMALDKTRLLDVLKKSGQSNLSLGPREHQQIQELVTILQPFAEVTNVVQGDKCITVSHVVPSVVQLTKTLTQLLTTIQYQLPMVKKLLRSLYERFRGIFELLGLRIPPTVVLTAQSASKNLHFTSDVYVCATALDPLHGYRWLDKCDLTSEAKETLKNKLNGWLVGMAVLHVCMYDIYSYSYK